MCDIKRPIFVECEVKTKKRSSLQESTSISEFPESFFIIALCIFHPLWMSTKRNQATQKNFQATQLWVATNRLKTLGEEDRKLVIRGSKLIYVGAYDYTIDKL